MMEVNLPFRSLFCLFISINLLNYVDRGIIPGASQEFDEFILASISTKQPDAYLGLLQSSFIVGFSIASILFAHLIKKSPPLLLATKGMSIWCFAIIGCSFCGQSAGRFQYTFLLFFRTLSGVGEASFCCIVPPLIQEKGGEKAGSWIAAFYTAIPFGTAVGFAYGSILANSSLGWQMAFMFEGLLMIPLIILLYIAHLKYSSIFSTETSSLEADMKPMLNHDSNFHEGLLAPTKESSLLHDLKIVISRRTFSLTVLGYAAYTAVTVGLSTFGPVFLVDLGFFQHENQASTVCGVILSISGLVGTPLGGVLLDRYRVRDQGRMYVCCFQNFLLTLFATILIMPTAFVKSAFLYCLLLGISCTVLFATTAGFNVAVMLSVPRHLQPLALAVNTVGIHAFGDVPSPILIGAMKDVLAPGCIGANDETCVDERPQIRMAILIVLSYLWVSVGFLGFAFLFERRTPRSC